jgi:hypothetical protein
MKLAEPSRNRILDDVLWYICREYAYPVWTTITNSLMYKVEDELELAQKYLDQLFGRRHET